MPGRPKTLDETKQAQLVALVAAGFTMRDAARLVGCHPQTVRNEARRGGQFASDLKRARSQAQVHPLRTMQQAATTNWRAAAWWLERLAPKTFAQPAEAVLGRREANKFVADLLAIIDQAVSDPVERERLHELLSAAMPGAMRRAWNYRQSRRKLEQAMAFFDTRQRLDNQANAADGNSVDRLLAPDPATEREIEQLLASIGKRLVEPPQED